MTKARDLANASTALSAVSTTELGYLDGVTSAVQTQVDAKLASSTAATTYVANSLADAKGDIFVASADNTVTRLPVGSTGDTIVADSSTATGLRYQGSMAAGKNAMINGAFDIWQRGTSISVASTVFAYTADRWLTNQQSAVTVTRQATNDTTNLPFVQYCARVQRNAGQTSTTVMQFTQPFETINAIPFAGRTVTFSFYARAGANFSGASNVFRGQVYSGTGTDQNLLQSYTGGAISVDSTNILTTSWQRFTATGTIPATATEIAPYFFYTPTGTAGANDYYEVTGVQLELGSVATAFARNSGTIQGELAACQRYYFRNAATNNYSMYGQGAFYSTTAAYNFVKFPVTMRTAPTALDYSNVSYYDYAGVAGISALTLGTAESSKEYASVTLSASGTSAQYRPCFLLATNTTSSYVGFSAEL